MRKAGWISLLALCATAVALSAKEFPLTFRSLTVDEAFALPGGSGTLGPLRAGKPSSLNHEPKAVSRHALYGELGRSASDKGFAFRVDETAGDGKGCDELLIDLNQNGDLADETPVKLAAKPRVTKVGSQNREICRFGPIELPVARSIGRARPVYFAELNHYQRQTTSGAANLVSSSLGYLRLRAGFVFETTVELGGIRQKVGVTDGNANLRIGDEPKATTYRNGGEESWFFSSADAFLRDTDGSGAFESRPGDPESSPFGAVLYLGATPCRVKLAADCTALSVERWNETLASVSVQPSGAQVREVLVAWEQKPNDWRLLKAGVAQGRISVPPGELRLTGCVLESETPDGQRLVLAGSYRKTDKSVIARAGQTATLRCGAPLEIKLTAVKRTETARSGAMYEADGLEATDAPVLRIQAEVLGAGGETYATFARGRDQAGEPPKPQFTLHTKDGKQVGSGNLEFG